MNEYNETFIGFDTSTKVYNAVLDYAIEHKWTVSKAINVVISEYFHTGWSHDIYECTGPRSRKINFRTHISTKDKIKSHADDINNAYPNKKVNIGRIVESILVKQLRLADA